MCNVNYVQVYLIASRWHGYSFWRISLDAIYKSPMPTRSLSDISYIMNLRQILVFEAMVAKGRLEPDKNVAVYQKALGMSESA